MGIALLAFSGLFKKIAGFQASHPAVSPRSPARLHLPRATRPVLHAVPSSQARPLQAKAPGLRVVMVHETGDGARTPGRLVMSGRMADVCAELDRLVALENRH